MLLFCLSFNENVHWDDNTLQKSFLHLKLGTNAPYVALFPVVVMAAFSKEPVERSNALESRVPNSILCNVQKTRTILNNSNFLGSPEVKWVIGYCFLIVLHTPHNNVSLTISYYVKKKAANVVKIRKYTLVEWKKWWKWLSLLTKRCSNN